MQSIDPTQKPNSLYTNGMAWTNVDRKLRLAIHKLKTTDLAIGVGKTREGLEGHPGATVAKYLNKSGGVFFYKYGHDSRYTYKTYYTSHRDFTQWQIGKKIALALDSFQIKNDWEGSDRCPCIDITLD